MNTSRTLTLVSLALALCVALPVLAAPPADNVLKVLKANKDLSKFTDLLDSAGIENELENKDAKFTLFAPTNAAMDKIPSDVMKRAKSTKDGLKSLAQHHMINGSIVFAGNIKGRKASPSSANGEMIGFDGTGKELKVGEGVITMADQVARNGVVHSINAPMIPDSLKDPKEKEEAKAKEEEAMKQKMEEVHPAMKGEKASGSVASPAVPTAPVVASPTAPTAPNASGETKPAKKSLLKSLFGM